MILENREHCKHTFAGLIWQKCSFVWTQLPCCLLPIAKGWKSPQKVLIAQLSCADLVTDLVTSKEQSFLEVRWYVPWHYPLLKIIFPIPFPSSSNSCLVQSHLHFQPHSFLLLPPLFYWKEGKATTRALGSASSCLLRVSFIISVLLVKEAYPLARSCMVVSILKKKWSVTSLASDSCIDLTFSLCTLLQPKFSAGVSPLTGSVPLPHSHFLPQKRARSVPAATLQWFSQTHMSPLLPNSVDFSVCILQHHLKCSILFYSWFFFCVTNHP